MNRFCKIKCIIILCSFFYLCYPYLSHAQCDFSNKVVNGDFSSGYSNFISGYSYCNSNQCLVPEGMFSVGNAPNNLHYAFVGGDHTQGNGNFMIVNGTETPNTLVWSQTVTHIQPNTLYYFSAWISNMDGADPAQIQFMINGVPLGDILSTPESTDTWQNFYITWSSGSNTSANISILDQNTSLYGNDFGVDDISFIQACALPVLFLQFDVHNQVHNVQLTWTASMERDIAFYEVEQSYDGVHFVPAGAVKASRNSGRPSSYTIYLPRISEATYFRVAAYDTDSKVTYSVIKACTVKEAAFRVSPNPVKDYIRIETTGVPGPFEISVINMYGERLFAYSGETSPYFQEEMVNMSGLPAGIYLVEYRNAEMREIRKIVKE